MSEWTKWEGSVDGECPVDNQPVVVRFRNGEEDDSRYVYDFRWTHSQKQAYTYPYDIVAYKVKENSNTEKPTPKDPMQIYCDNFLTLSKALQDVESTTNYLATHHEFLQTLARNGIEVSAVVHKL